MTNTNEVKTLKETIENLERKADNMVQETNNKNIELHEQAEKYEQTISELNQEIEELQEEIEGIQGDCEGVDADVKVIIGEREEWKKCAETYKEKYLNVLRQNLTELEQKHIYNTTYSGTWVKLKEELDMMRLAIAKSEDIAQIKLFVEAKEIIQSKLQNMYLDAVYKGALSDVYDYPETTQELRIVFVDAKTEVAEIPIFDIYTD